MRQLLYRGLSAQVWQQRLESAGWPSLAAEDMAHWLVGDDTQRRPPRWSNMLLADELLRNLAQKEPKGELAEIIEATKEKEL